NYLVKDVLTKAEDEALDHSGAPAEEDSAGLTLLCLSSRFLLKDKDGDVIPIAACIPPGEYDIVLFPDPSHDPSQVHESATVPLNLQDTLQIESVERLKRPIRAQSSTLTKKYKKASPTYLMKHFLEAFTMPLAPDDVINFIPNHGDFGIDRLYAQLVPQEYLPQDTTTFYKLASSSIVLDRQRVIRFYRVGNTFAQLLAVGKGPLLRAYVNPTALRTPPHNAKLRAFAECLDDNGDNDGTAVETRLLAIYESFLGDFTPISRVEFMAKSE
ncbi:hypothetical protein AeNC1_015912, partial [Aphanomyces euteiches]